MSGLTAMIHVFKNSSSVKSEIRTLQVSNPGMGYASRNILCPINPYSQKPDSKTYGNVGRLNAVKIEECPQLCGNFDLDWEGAKS